MSSSFIGSKIAIVTKSQCRYVGTIIGIDAEASSIILGNVKCFGTENRGGNLSNGQMPGAMVPIMQFANSDIEDLKIVDEEQQSGENSSKKPPTTALASSSKQPSIHDDPAIVSAVMSTTQKDSSMSNRLIHDLQHLKLSDEKSKILPKKEESRIRADSGELGPSWSLLSPSKWTTHNSSSQPAPPLQQPSGNKSKFFDDFTFNATDSLSSNRPQQHQRWPSNTHSTQTSHRQYQHEDDSALPVRQPFFSDDQSYSSQQQIRPQNGHQQRNFYNNRRPQQRRPVGGNRETFYDNGNLYEAEFDFETSNRKFNKLASEGEFKQQSDSSNQYLPPAMDEDLTAEYKPLYDKKKSFFDNIAQQETSDLPVPMYHRSRNQDTFGNNGNDQYQRQKNRGGGAGPGYRRSNNQNYRQQQGNDDFQYRQQYNNSQNGYHYRY